MEQRRTWREQYYRIHRLAARLGTGTEGEERVDDFYSFFMHCFHLGDWIAADQWVPSGIGAAAKALTEGGRDNRPDGDPALMRCADIANGVKHLAATRTPRLDPHARVESTESFTQDDLFQDDMVQQAGTWVVVGGQVDSASQLAQDCLDAWEGFLIRHGLLTPAR